MIDQTSSQTEMQSSFHTLIRNKLLVNAPRNGNKFIPIHVKLFSTFCPKLKALLILLVKPVFLWLQGAIKSK